MGKPFCVIQAVGLAGPLAVSVILGGLAAAVLAQEPPEEERQEQPRFEDMVEVTGSLIPRPTLEAASPVTVLEPEDIARSGVTRLEDLLVTLPQVVSYQNAGVSNLAAIPVTGTAAVDLRLLGEVRTLVLVNGRRMPVGDVYSTVGDLNFIPAALVKRVDVLTGGASSVYGADAVAGVVNFILDTELEGFKGGVEYGAYQHDNRNEVARRANAQAGYAAPRGGVWDGDVASAYAALGGTLAGGRGHATVYIDYRHIDAVTKDQRDYSNCPLEASVAGPWCSGNPAIPGGRFTALGRTPGSAQAYVLDPATDELRRPTGSDLYNDRALSYLQRPDRRWLAGAFIAYAFNPHVDGYIEAMFMADSTEAQIAPGGDFSFTSSINCANPMLTEQQHELFCTQLGYSDDEYANVIINRRSVETGNRYEALRHTAWRLLAGARGRLDERWSYDVYGMHAEVQIPESYHNDLNVERMQDALLVVGDGDDPGTWRCMSGNPGCAPWNIFSAGGVTQAAADYIRTSASSQNRTQTDILEGTLDGDLEGYGWKLPSAAEGVQVALGASYRRERLVIDPDEVERNGLAGSFGRGVTPVDGAYSVKELYAEGRLPLIQQRAGAQDLTLELGYRYSDYNLSGRHPTSKVQLSYAPLVGLKLRAGLAHAVRAPNVVELFTPQALGPGWATDICQNDPRTGAPWATPEQCMRTGVTPEQYGHLLPNPAAYGRTQDLFSGDPRLDPEKADTRTFGVVLTPPGLPGFTAAVDYYEIDLEGAIISLPTNAVFTICLLTGDPRVCGLIHRDTTGSLWLTPDGYIIRPLQNAGAPTNRGVDVNLSDVRSLGEAGYLTASLTGSYLIERTVRTPFFAYDCAGYFGNGCLLALPRWRHRLTVSWESPFDTVLTLGWRMIGPVTNDAASSDPVLGRPADIPKWKASGSYRYPSYHFFDLAATYDVTKGIQLTAGVTNLFDREPPLGAGLEAVNYGPGFAGEYDPYGRFVHASLRFAF